MENKHNEKLELEGIPLPVIHRDFKFTAKDADSFRVKAPIRAITYQVVARGSCPSCMPLGGLGGPSAVPLRFVYNPYGDDLLLCERCANTINERMAEDSQTP